MSISNEDYLNKLIAKAKKSWDGVDVDSYMNNLRNDSFDKEVAGLTDTANNFKV